MGVGVVQGLLVTAQQQGVGRAGTGARKGGRVLGKQRLGSGDGNLKSMLEGHHPVTHQLCQCPFNATAGARDRGRSELCFPKWIWVCIPCPTRRTPRALQAAPGPCGTGVLVPLGLIWGILER